MEKARREFTASSTEDNRIMLGRSLSSVGRFREAIAVYTDGLREYPDSPLFYRLRGHRYITIRQFGRTVADLKKAAALIQARPPAGRSGGLLTPAERVAPETRFVIYYHLGLACYLARDFAKAEAAYRKCFKWSKGDDVIVAVDVIDGCQEGDS